MVSEDDREPLSENTSSGSDESMRESASSSDEREPVSESVTSGNDESIKESANSSSNSAQARDQGASDFRKETLYQKRSLSPRAILRACLEASFNKEDARAFCFEYCNEVYQDLSDTTSFSRIFTMIIEYYELRGREQDLWQWVRERNASNYQKWFDKWEEATKRHQSRGSDASGSHGKDGAGEKVKEDRVYSTFTGQVIKQVKGQSGTKDGAADSMSSGEAVLASGEREAISGWFFRELTAGERGMVLATALFQKINRHYLAALSRDVEDIFFGEPNASSRDGQS